jgi:serine/threonine-protein kinase
MFVAGGVVALASAYTLVSRRTSGTPRPVATDAASIAVLAFRNIGGDPNNEPLSDGISEEIATTLGKLDGLHVKAPRSAFSFKGTALSLAQIGERLGVRYLIDGGVSKAGNQLRITVQLINAANDSTLWAEDYRRPDRDVFAVQDEIARAISEKLRVQLTAGARTTIAARSTGDPEAHALYLQGRYFFEKRDSVALARAQRYFEQAIAKDTSYALAYAGLSDTYGHRSVFGFALPNESFPLAKRYAAKALALDSTLAEVHSSLAFIALFYDWDLPTAGREFQRALALGPNYPSAHLWRGWYFMATDSTAAGVAEVRRAVELDPFWTIGNTRLVTMLFYAGRYPEALAQAQRTFEMDSLFFQTRVERARVYARLGRCAEALEDLSRSGYQGAAQLTGVRGYTYARCGRRTEALSELSRLAAADNAGKYISHYGLAVIQAGLGDADQAIAELDRAYFERAWPMFMLRLEPAFDGLRNDPRFTAILKKVGRAP